MKHINTWILIISFTGQILLLAYFGIYEKTSVSASSSAIMIGVNVFCFCIISFLAGKEWPNK